MGKLVSELSLPLRLRKALAHLGSRSSLTPLEALGLYGEQRLADVVYELRARGYKINMETRVDPNGRRYGRYSLAKELVAA